MAVAGLAPGYIASEPLLVVASAGDGVVPLRRVEQALPAQMMLQVPLPCQMMLIFVGNIKMKVVKRKFWVD